MKLLVLLFFLIALCILGILFIGNSGEVNASMINSTKMMTFKIPLYEEEYQRTGPINEYELNSYTSNKKKHHYEYSGSGNRYDSDWKKERYERNIKDCKNK